MQAQRVGNSFLYFRKNICWAASFRGSDLTRETGRIMQKSSCSKFSETFSCACLDVWCFFVHSISSVVQCIVTTSTNVKDFEFLCLWIDYDHQSKIIKIILPLFYVGLGFLRQIIWSLRKANSSLREDFQNTAGIMDV